MFKLILQAIWFFGPAGMANMAPILAKKVPFLKALDIPIDGYKTFRGKRIFGDHKTIRGFVAGFILALLTSIAQYWAYHTFPFVQNNLAFFDYTTVNPVLWAFLSSQGALLGDAIESFFKRQTNHPPGSNWFPFDQIDFIIGTVLATSLVTPLSLRQYIAVFIVVFLLHPTINVIGYILRLKDKPF